MKSYGAQKYSFCHSPVLEHNWRPFKLNICMILLHWKMTAKNTILSYKCWAPELMPGCIHNPGESYQSAILEVHHLLLPGPFTTVASHVLSRVKCHHALVAQQTKLLLENLQMCVFYFFLGFVNYLLIL